MADPAPSGTLDPVIAIVQARMTSTRLPGKVLADFTGRPMLACMLDRVRRSARLDRVWVATTTNAADDPVAALCGNLGVPVFRGDEHDVLSRYADAARDADAGVVVRLTADCPLADPAVIDEAVGLLLTHGHDYVSNVIERSFPDGLDVEVFTRAALDAADREACSPFQREHVTPYLRTGRYPDAGTFSVGHLRAPADFSHLRWTVDTADDLAHVTRIAERVPPSCGWLDVVALLVRRPDLLARGKAYAIVLRRAGAADSELLFDWVNRPESLAAKLETREPITRETHERWFAARLDSPVTRIWIAERAGAPVGQVRAERDREGRVHVDVFVVPEARGAGLAFAMVDELVREVAATWPGATLVARVRVDNAASRRLFAKAGFEVTETHADHVVLERAAVWPGPSGHAG